ncbi:hypothetical protein [Bacillus pakistanensis]|uniref:hypothetical protein n=1 Tax=Rossellomorea pakistanensis TaxID=992288 RepID=UPI001964ED08|nr:hypothetical protein [Bacillus pakistanensis]
MNAFEKVHQQPSLTHKEQKKFSSMLIKKHERESIDILQKYEIDCNELLKGGHCPAYLAIPGEII